MENVFAVSLLTMFVIIVYRKLNNRYQETLFKNSLYELRDELRLLLLDKKVSVKSTAFDYMDFSITTATSKSYYFTLFYIFVNELKHQKAKKDLEDYKEIYNKLNTEISENRYLSEINKRKNITIYRYIIGQNKITFYIFDKIFQVVFGIKKVKEYIKSTIDSLNFLPETSGINLC